MSWENKIKLAEEREVSTIKGDHTALDTPGMLESKNPRSIINIAPEGMKELIEKLPREFLEMSERRLHEVVDPDPMLNRVRLAFWKEYDIAQGEIRKMGWLGVTKMVQRPSVMLKRMMEDPLKLAWILCPPANYDVFLEEAIQHGMTRIREILDLSLQKEDGSIDTRVGELILKATAFIDLRRHGGFVQKQVNVDLGSGITERQMKNVAEQINIEDISKKIELLESELGRKHKKDVIDV